MKEPERVWPQGWGGESRRRHSLFLKDSPILLTWKVLLFEQDCQTGQD